MIRKMLVIIALLIVITPKVDSRACSYSDGPEGSTPTAVYVDFNPCSMMTEWDIFVKKILLEDAMDVLERCVEAEATGGSLQQKMNVASCILNRVRFDGYPDTIHDVVFEKGQFSVISDKRYYSVGITDSTREACSRVLQYGCTHDGTYFCTATCKSGRPGGWHEEHLKFLFFDGEHRHYRPYGKGESRG